MSAIARVGLNGKEIPLLNGGIDRPFSTMTSWNVIRIGARGWLDGPNADINPLGDFMIGLCSSNSSPYHPTNSTDNFIGAGALGANAPYNIGSAGNQYRFNSARRFRRVGTTTTNGTNLGTRYISSVATVRTAFMVTITRGSPNFTVDYFTLNSSAAVADFDDASFDLQMVQPNPAFSGYSNSTGQTFSIDEGTNGVLDRLNIYWGHATYPLVIQDVAVARLG